MVGLIAPLLTQRVSDRGFTPTALAATVVVTSWASLEDSSVTA
jgi:hypothetical protein